MAGPHEKRDAEGFTSLERRFAKLYLVDFNATNAYIAASTRVPKPSRKTAEANGHRLLQEDRIQRLVRQVMLVAVSAA